MKVKDIKKGDVLFKCNKSELCVLEVLRHRPKVTFEGFDEIVTINRITSNYHSLIIRSDKDLDELVFTSGGYYTSNEDKAVNKYKELTEDETSE